MKRLHGSVSKVYNSSQAEGWISASPCVCISSTHGRGRPQYYGIHRRRRNCNFAARFFNSKAGLLHNSHRCFQITFRIVALKTNLQYYIRQRRPLKYGRIRNPNFLNTVLDVGDRSHDCPDPLVERFATLGCAQLPTEHMGTTFTPAAASRHSRN